MQLLNSERIRWRGKNCALFEILPRMCNIVCYNCSMRYVRIDDNCAMSYNTYIPAGTQHALFLVMWSAIELPSFILLMKLYA